MHPLDIAILAVIGLSALTGLWRGLINILFSLSGFFFGLVLGRKYGESISNLIFHTSSGWQKLIGFIIVVLATLILAMIIGWLIKKLLSLLMLGWLDRVAGLIVGALLALLFWSLILTLAYQIPELRGIISNSAVASFILRYLSWGEIPQVPLSSAKLLG